MTQLSTALDRSRCPDCQTAIWLWHWMGIPFKIDTEPIRAADTELAHRLLGRMTYTVRRNRPDGFDLDFRWRWSIRPGDWTSKIILADHTCTDTPTATWPDYFPTPTPTPATDDIEGFPF